MTNDVEVDPLVTELAELAFVVHDLQRVVDGGGHPATVEHLHERLFAQLAVIRSVIRPVRTD